MKVTPGRRRPGGSLLSRPISVRVDTSIWESAKEAAHAQNTSMSALVSNLLEEWLEKNPVNGADCDES